MTALRERLAALAQGVDLTLEQLLEAAEHIQHENNVAAAQKHIARRDARDAAYTAMLAALHEWADECAECDGEGVLSGEVGFAESCPSCADIRAVIAIGEASK